MATNLNVTDVAIQKLFDAVIASTRNQGTNQLPSAAPNAWTDRNSKQSNASDTTEYELTVRVGPGAQATAVIKPIGSKALSIQGVLDTGILATKLV